MSTTASASDLEETLGEEMLEICRKIDADGNGSISQFELINAIKTNPEVASFVLSGVDEARLSEEESNFDAIDELFEAMGGGKQRLKYKDFVAHFKRKAAEASSNMEELKAIYSLMDSDDNGCVSKLELYEAVKRHPKVAQLAFLRRSSSHGLDEEEMFDAAKHLFEAVARGKKRFDFMDLKAYFADFDAADLVPVRTEVDRASKRVLIISPGFGRSVNHPRQSEVVEEAGYQVHWCWEGLPIPEQPNFDVMPYLHRIRADIDAFQPDVIACGSKGGSYLVALWAHGFWRGASLLINSHPQCVKLPEGTPVVLCQGSNDETFPTTRAKLEELLSTGCPSRCFLYYTANSGQLPSGHFSRVGDRHNMESILQHDCLPRLLDAAMSSEGPELHIVRTWRERLTSARLEAEQWLGYSPIALSRRWASRGRGGRDDRKLFDLPAGCEEFQKVVEVFKAQPREGAAYTLSPPGTWERVQVRKVERIENGALFDNCTMPYYASVQRSIQDQGMLFEPGVHTTWGFHGADAAAIDSIVSNPVAGFQPLASGTRGAALWGSGTYFARDARYVADGGFCGQPAADGTRRMLMCLMMSGMPCLGDPKQRGVLPFRQQPHRYHCAVDCLSSPEIYIMQHAGAAHAAYLITFS